MENTEIMNESMETMVNDIVANDAPGMGNGAAIAVGVALVAAIGAAIGVGKMLWDKHKAKQEVNKPDHEIEVTEEDVQAVAAK